jgi:GrpB-like predicted nucleotidyltransferase (UPF0157 family)
MSDEPTTTSAPDAPAPEEEPAPDETPDEGPAEVEAMLGLDDFLAAHPMKPAAAAMLKTWMRRQGKDSAGHYPLEQWEAEYQAMLVST